jgi:hypothetical protein
MSNNTAIEKINNPELRQQLSDFIDTIKTHSGENLKSAILFGGVAKGDYTKGKSNTNVLLVFEKIDLEVLDQLAVPFQLAIANFQFSPFLLTSSEVAPAKNVFAVKLFDMQQHHILLHGNDVLSPLQINREHLRFISEQELRNQLSRMKYFYIRNFNLPEQLLDKIKKSFTTLLVNANTYLYLKIGIYYTTREEIILALEKESLPDESTLNELVLLRKGVLQPDSAQTAQLYSRLMLQFKYIIKELEKL